MNIENILKQLKEVLPPENFKIQPAAALEEILQLEKEYNINTSDFINDEILATTIAEDVRDRWINTLDTFINFNGSMADLNHLPSVKESLNNKSFINNQNSMENSAKEYAKKKSKESSWPPCSFLCINNFINSYPFLRME